MNILAQIPSPSMPTTDPNQASQMLPLRDIKLPAEPGFWPLAPGWWLIIAVLVLLLIWLAYKWYQHHKKKQRWLSINNQLSALEHDYQQNHDKRQLLSSVSVLLRRFVKYQQKQHQATTLSGQNWIQYLNQFDSSQPFNAYEQALTSGVYQVHCDYDANGLIQTTREFMRQQVMKPAKTDASNNDSAQNLEQSHV